MIDLVSYLICKRDKISKIIINNTAGSAANKLISNLRSDEAGIRNVSLTVTIDGSSGIRNLEQANQVDDKTI